MGRIFAHDQAARLINWPPKQTFDLNRCAGRQLILSNSDLHKDRYGRLVRRPFLSQHMPTFREAPSFRWRRPFSLGSFDIGSLV